MVEVGGATYVQLSTDAAEIAAAKSGRVHLAPSKDSSHDASATVAASAAARARLHDWIGKRVMVDGTCTANVVGFAKIARLAGNTGYARMDDSDGTWTASDVMDHGAAMLAAKLDGCHGTWARDAALPAAIVAHPAAEQPRSKPRSTATSSSRATRPRTRRPTGRSSWPGDDFAST